MTTKESLSAQGAQNEYHPRDQPLSGQQIQALQKQQAERLVAITKDVELRKWAVDQACSLAGAAYEAADLAVVPVDVVTLAKSIHNFLVEGANERA